MSDLIQEDATAERSELFLTPIIDGDNKDALLRIASILNLNTADDFRKLRGDFQMQFLASLSRICDDMLVMIKSNSLRSYSAFSPLALAIFVTKLDLYKQIIEVNQIDEISLMNITHIRIQLEQFKTLINPQIEG